MKSLSLRDKVAQLVMITSYGEALSSRSSTYKDLVHSVSKLRVGGLIVVNRVSGGTVRHAEPHAMATFVNRMQRLAKVPLLVGADFERGASMRVSGTVKYPHQMAYGAAADLSLTRALGLATAREARALGVHWVFAPVADINSNPENPIINIRSFGEDPKAVGEHVAAFIEGAHSSPNEKVLVTAKHFPGHGDTNVDSHMGLPRLEADRSRIANTELVPFHSAIKAGVDAVMTAHMAVPALEPEGIPATISPSVLSGVLRGELNFDGLVVTDAMDMQGLTKQVPGGEAAVRALQAGADMLLMPPNPDGAIAAVMEALRDGRLTEKRIEESVVRVLAAKAKLRLDRKRYVDVEAISDVLESPELVQHAQTAADRAITLVRNTNGIVPLKQPESACVYVLAESRSGVQGRRFQEEVRARSKNTKVFVLDPHSATVESDHFLEASSGCESLVLAAFVTVGAYRGNVALGGGYPQLVQALLTRRPVPVILVSLGSPYLLRSFPEVSAYLAAYSPAPTSEAAVVKALFGDIPVGGRLPVTIPGLAAMGDGLKVVKN
ncbi:MAG TPA: glycoside hydrolase family 3 N-terminal domain-containing protein [Bryobacteraceae bacterium]|nr:glycoside hydrolase family 3 N-terminal domain-containing protein [Bryobacteraceae bacterium]